MNGILLLLFAMTPLPVSDAQVYEFKHNSPELGIRKGNEGVAITAPFTATADPMGFDMIIPEGWGVASVDGDNGEGNPPPFMFEGNKLFWHYLPSGKERALTVRLYGGLGAANLAKRIKAGKEFKIWSTTP